MKILNVVLGSLFFCLAAHANILDADGVLKNASGQLVLMDFYEARKACPQGTHIPSAHEAATLLQGYGARGIDDLAPPECGFFDHASRVSTLRSSGVSDTFCFYTNGFIPPTSDFARGIFWTSSYATGFDRPYTYAFYGSSSGFEPFYSGPRGSTELHVLCVANIP